MTSPEQLTNQTDRDWYREFICKDPILPDIALADVVAASAFLGRQSAPATYQALAKALGIAAHKAFDVLQVLIGLGVALRHGQVRRVRFCINPAWTGDVTLRVNELAAKEPPEFSESERILSVLTLASYGALPLTPA